MNCGLYKQRCGTHPILPQTLNSVQEGRCDGGSIEGQRVAVSGAGNVAYYAVEKLIELGAIPVTMSDSSGTVYEPEGITREGLDHIADLKSKGSKLSEYKSPGDGARTAKVSCTGRRRWRRL